MTKRTLPKIDLEGWYKSCLPDHEIKSFVSTFHFEVDNNGKPLFFIEFAKDYGQSTDECFLTYCNTNIPSYIALYTPSKGGIESFRIKRMGKGLPFKIVLTNEFIGMMQASRAFLKRSLK